MSQIYFAGSIRAGREDASLYRDIISFLKENHTVLTEHIGNTHLSSLECDEQDHDIYVQDTAWLKQCDIVIAECTRPSLGVGYELAYAESIGKPVHIFYRPKDTKLSAMLTGNPYFQIHRYETFEELKSALTNVLK